MPNQILNLYNQKSTFMKDTKLLWFQEEQILSEHKDLLIGQIYVWFVTKDRKLAIVGKGEKWQFPGGKPDYGETIEEALARECFEEAGIVISDYNEVPLLFGYYLTENDPNPYWKGQNYIKLRYLLHVNKTAAEIELSNNERVDDVDTLDEAKFIPIDELVDHIFWIEDKQEYKDVLVAIQ